jgi:hypothetical protein
VTLPRLALRSPPDGEALPIQATTRGARARMTCSPTWRSNASDATRLSTLLEREAHFRFVDSEGELNALPIEDDEVDVIVGARRMDVSTWIEDEAILSLPLIARHEWEDVACRPVAEVGTTVEPSADSTGREHPFAVLAGLKPGSKAS